MCPLDDLGTNRVRHKQTLIRVLTRVRLGGLGSLNHPLQPPPYSSYSTRRGENGVDLLGDRNLGELAG